MTGTQAVLYPHREHLLPVAPLLNVPKRSQASVPCFPPQLALLDDAKYWDKLSFTFGKIDLDSRMSPIPFSPPKRVRMALFWLFSSAYQTRKVEFNPRQLHKNTNIEMQSLINTSDRRKTTSIQSDTSRNAQMVFLGREVAESYICHNSRITQFQ